jgi:hypothetical protein
MPAPRLTSEDIAVLEATHARGVVMRRRAEETPAPKPTQPLLSPVKTGLGRSVALHHRSSASYHMH